MEGRKKENISFYFRMHECPKVYSKYSKYIVIYLYAEYGTKCACSLIKFSDSIFWYLQVYKTLLMCCTSVPYYKTNNLPRPWYISQSGNKDIFSASIYASIARLWLPIINLKIVALIITIILYLSLRTISFPPFEIITHSDFAICLTLSTFVEFTLYAVWKQSRESWILPSFLRIKPYEDERASVILFASCISKGKGVILLPNSLKFPVCRELLTIVCASHFTCRAPSYIKRHGRSTLPSNNWHTRGHSISLIPARWAACKHCTRVSCNVDVITNCDFQ